MQLQERIDIINSRITQLAGNLWSKVDLHNKYKKINLLRFNKSQLVGKLLAHHSNIINQQKIIIELQYELKRTYQRLRLEILKNDTLKQSLPQDRTLRYL